MRSLLALALSISLLSTIFGSTAFAAPSLSRPLIFDADTTFRDVGEISISGYNADEDVQASVSVPSSLGRIKLATTAGLSAVTGYSSADWTSGNAYDIAFFGSESDVSRALNSLQFKASGNGVSGDISINTFVRGTSSIAFNSQTNRFYQVVQNGSAISWELARCRAKYANSDVTFSGTTQSGTTTSSSTLTNDGCVSQSTLVRRSFGGLRGYLANITTESEHTFLTSKITGNGWIGGSDVTSEGTWVWNDGPEAGMVFWLEGSVSAATWSRRTTNNFTSVSPKVNGFTYSSSVFNYWSDGEPNNSSSSEDFAEFGFGNSGTLGKSWNDCQNSCGGRTQYIVEYGDTGDTLIGANGSISIRTKPSAPTNLVATAANLSASLTWTAASSGGAEISGHKIEYQASGGSWQTAIENTGNSSNSYTATGLTGSVSYKFRVTALNSLGLGDVSADSNQVTIPDATSPNLSSASVSSNGQSIALQFDESINTQVPATSSITILVGAQSISPTSIAVSGNAVTLNLGITIQNGAVVSLSYVDPSSGDDASAIQDTTGNDLASLSNISVINNSSADTVSPSVNSVAISTTPGSGQSNQYRIGETITVSAQFSESVNVTGSPTISLLVGSDTRTATYAGGTGSTTLTFNYGVQAGDSDSDGIEVIANSISGTIRDVANNNAVLSHSAVAANVNQKVDGVRATVNGFTLSQTRLYKLDETVTVTASFSETVTVTGSPRIPIVGLTNEFFEYSAGDSTETSKVFRYTVDSDDIDADGIEISANSIDLNSGSIKDGAGNDSTLTTSGRAPPGTPQIDGVAPTVTNFRTSKSAGTFTVGETITVTANLSETVTAGAKITVTLSSGGTAELNYATDSTLVGTYTVGASDTATVLTVTSFVLNTAPTDGAGNPMTSTSVPGAAGNLDEAGARNIRIDTSKPVLTGSTSVSINENTTAVGTFTADENVSWSLLSVAQGGGADVSRFSLSSNSGSSTNLAFTAAPNFEKPLDSDGNNIYLVTLRAVDAAGNVETSTVTATILNVSDAATVTSIQITSTPTAPGTTSGSSNTGGYVVGEVINVVVTFSETVTVNAVTGYPRIELQGLASKFAVYAVGSGTDQLEFRYTVVPGDVDNDGVSILINSIELDTASIKNADEVDSALNHTAISANVAQRVDAFAPLLASSNPVDNATGVALDANIVITMTKAVVKGTGNIVIRNGANIFESIAVTASNVTISSDGLTITINPTGTFANATDYYVLIDSTAFKDASGNFFPGIASATTLNFKSRSAITIATPSTGLTGYVGLAYSLTLSTSGVVCGTSCTFALDTGTLPAGLSLNATTGAITGTPTTAGASAIRVRVTDVNGTTVVTNSFTITVSNPTFRQFDNGKIRIGSATGENSINNKGNFQQPWYRSGSTYFKLTFSSYSLNFAFGQGSTNTSYFNGNILPLVQDPTMTNQEIDYSGFVGTSVVGTGIRGYGTIISTGTFTLGSNTYRLRNTFVLGETSSSIRVSSEVTNLSSTTGNNLTFWVGTQDDWVGGTDRPTKTKGNLVNGAFTAIANASTLAKALKVSSGAEAVLFFTNQEGANTSHDGCCSFTNTTRKDPRTSLITNTNDGSYAMYVPMGNLTAGSTFGFTWYYAAGPSAELATVESNLSTLANDTTAPTISSVAVTSNAGSDQTYKVGDPIDITVTFSENVNITGTPRIPIEGLTGAFANFASGSGTNQIRFRYVVQSTNVDVDGISIAANSLSLNAGSIGDASGNAAVLTHAALAAQSAHKVDGIVPTLASANPADGTVGVAVNSNIELTFSEPVAAGTGTIFLRKLGATPQVIEQIPISGSRVTISGNTVLINPDSTLESSTQYSVQIENGAITDVSGNAFAGISDDTTLNFTSANASAPTISRVEAVTSNGTYRTLDQANQPVTISIRVVFSKIVNVTQGTGKPTLTLETGSTDRKANYVSGSGSPNLIFEYAIQGGDLSADLDYVSVESLVLEGNSTITDAAGNNATLTLPNPGTANSLGGRSAIVIDAVAPTLSASLPANNATNVLANANLTFTFSENLSAGLGSIQLNKIVNSVATLIESTTVTSGMINANVLTFNPSADLESASTYRLTISSDAVRDLAGNPFANSVDINFTSENFNATTPTISSQPTAVTSTIGRSATLSVTGSTTDLGTLSYQWLKGGVPIPGATSNTYVIPSLSSGDAGDYSVVVTNTYRGNSASTTSNVASVTVNSSLSASFASTDGSVIAVNYGSTGSATAPTVSGGTGSRTYSIALASNGQSQSGISINSSTGVISTTASLPAGTYTMSVTVTDSVGATFSTTITISIARKTVTITGATASNKQYDGTRNATLNFSSASIVGLESSDNGAVSIVSSSAIGLFDNANVGNSKQVTTSGITLFGPAADNYQVTQPTLSANITRGSQTISITSSAPTRPLPGRSYTPTATSNSGLSVVITVDTASVTAGVCAINAGVVSFTVAGACVINFDQTGDSNWNAATRVTQSLTVGLLGQNITFAALSNKSFGDPAFQVAATTDSGLLPSFASTSSSNICTVTSLGVVKVIGVGSCEITASQAGNSAYQAAASVTRSFTINPVIPTAPRISSIFAGNEQATVSWTAPQDNGGSAITSYEVISTPDDKTCSTTGALSCTVYTLTNGQAYTFKVRAVNAAGNGPWSAISPTVQPVTKADAVSDLVLIPGDRQLTVSWNPPVNLGGGTFVRYELYIKRAIGGSYDTATVLTSQTSDSYTYTELVNGVQYTVKVLTITSSVSSSSATEISGNTAEVSQIPAQAPSAPRNLVAIAPSGTSATVTWATPLSNGGAAITGYQVNASVGGRALVCAMVTSNSCFIETITVGTNLLAGQSLRAKGASAFSTGGSLQVGVSAVNLIGAGETATVSVALPNAPGAPVITKVEKVSGEIQVTFTAPSDTGGAPITGYTVVAYKRGSIQAFETCLTSQLICGFIMAGEIYEYDYKVFATNLAGDGPLSQIFSPPTPSRGGGVEVPSTPLPLPGSNGALPTLNPGKSVVTDSGQLVPATMQIIEKTILSITNGDMKLEISAINADKAKQPIKEGGILQFTQQEMGNVSGSGFKPDSKATIWIFSTPVKLGDFVVSKEGKLVGDFLIPPSVAPGIHTLQINGVSAKGALVSYTIGVEVLENIFYKVQKADDLNWSFTSEIFKLAWQGLDLGAKILIVGTDGSRRELTAKRGESQIEVQDLEPGFVYTVTFTPEGLLDANSVKSLTIDLAPREPQSVKIYNLGNGVLRATWSRSKGDVEYGVYVFVGGKVVEGITQSAVADFATKQNFVDFKGEPGVQYDFDIFSISATRKPSAVSSTTGVLVSKDADVVTQEPEKPVVEEPKSPTKTPVLRSTIYFAKSGTKLDTRDRAEVKKFARTLKKGQVVICQAYVYGEKSARKKAKARAEAGCSYLKKIAKVKITATAKVTSVKKAPKAIKSLSKRDIRRIDLVRP